MRFLAVDPSINRIGWALFDSQAGKFDVLDSWNFGAFCPAGQGRLEKLTHVKEYFSRGQADHLICEMPTFFESERGRIAAKEGYTNTLSLVIGTIYGVMPNVQLFLYTPQQWKGAVPKRVTMAQFRRVFSNNGHYNPVHDTIDAIMMLRYHLKVHF